MLQAACPSVRELDKHAWTASGVKVTALDGFVAVMGGMELDSTFQAQPVLLAWERDDRPLDGHHGPFQLIVPEDLRHSRITLEQVTGRRVHGFRAPSFSIVPGIEWAFDILLEEGFTWDSSLFPIRRPEYGYPESPRDPYVIRRKAGSLLELPLATTTFMGMRLPAAGGAYLRQLPYALTRRAFREHSERGVPAMFYMHPWEIDDAQPRLRVKMLSRLRHYRGLDGMLGRVDRLLTDFRFTSVERALDVPGLRAAA